MLQIKNLVKSFPGGVRAVDNVSLHVAPGDIYGFIGHNGAGKTTTIKCVTGLYDFDEGEIYVDGKSCSVKRAVTIPRRYVKTVFHIQLFCCGSKIARNIRCCTVRVA